MGEEFTIPRPAIVAGYQVLEDSGRLAEGPLSSDRLLPQQVLFAMLRHLSNEQLLQAAERARSTR